MTVTIQSDIKYPEYYRPALCMCLTDDVESEYDFSDKNLKIIRELASKSCPVCHGEGWIRELDDSETPYINWSNANAYAVLTLLKLNKEFNDRGYIETKITDLLKRIKAALAEDGSKDVDPIVANYIPTVGNDNNGKNVIVLVRSYVSLANRLLKLELFAKEEKKKGAKVLIWS